MKSWALMTVDEFCEESRMSRATFYNLKNKKMLPNAFKIGGRTYISRRSFEAWIAEKEADAAAA